MVEVAADQPLDAGGDVGEPRPPGAHLALGAARPGDGLAAAVERLLQRQPGVELIERVVLPGGAEAAACEPMDAMERLDVEMAKAELEE